MERGLSQGEIEFHAGFYLEDIAERLKEGGSYQDREIAAEIEEKLRCSPWDAGRIIQNIRDKLEKNIYGTDYTKFPILN